MKSLAVAIALSLSAFFACFYLFKLKSFYPYRVSSRITSELTSYLDERQFFPHLKAPFNLDENSFFIDEVIKNKDESITINGRFYTPSKSEGANEDFISNALKLKVLDFMEESFCAERIDVEKGHIRDQLATLAPKKINCRKTLMDGGRKTVSIGGTVLTDDNRTGKILFISLVISIFFGIAIFITSEALSSLKNVKS